jgi:hypothetical protein
MAIDLQWSEPSGAGVCGEPLQVSAYSFAAQAFLQLELAALQIVTA